MIPMPGDFGVVRTHGWAARWIRIGTDSPVNHAVVYIGRGLVIEARPKGAGYAPLEQYARARWSSGVPALALTAAQRAAIPSAAAKLVGTPYSWLDIAALSLATFGLRWRWVNERIERTDRLICSQLADRLRQAVGNHLFTDGRISCEVTPGDLLGLIEQF
jgi:uncharacterized protein YycO